MKSRWTKIAMLVLTVGLIGVNGATAEETPRAEAKKLVNQTRCPVMGGKIDSAAYTDIQGQRVYHCCAGCSEKLRKDPDTYFKKAAEQGILFENVQVTCPVTGKAINKGHMTDFEGRRVYFCSENCQATFAKEPAKYLKELDKTMPKETAKEAKSHDDHSGHGGH